jgi:hypothetical protein
MAHRMDDNRLADASETIIISHANKRQTPPKHCAQRQRAILTAIAAMLQVP